MDERLGMLWGRGGEASGKTHSGLLLYYSDYVPEFSFHVRLIRRAQFLGVREYVNLRCKDQLLVKSNLKARSFCCIFAAGEVCGACHVMRNDLNLWKPLERKKCQS